MKLHQIILSTLVLLTSSVYCQMLDSITIMYDNGQHEAVIEAVNSQESMNEEISAQMYYLRGQCHNYLGNQADAKADLTHAASLDTGNVAALVALAGIYEQQESYAKASKYYGQVIKLRPSDGYYYRKNAKMMHLSGAEGDAFRLYATAHRLNPRDLVTIGELTTYLLDSDQYKSVDSLIDYALGLDSMHLGLQYSKAISKYKQRDYGAVVNVLEKIESLVDLKHSYQKMLGYAYLQIDSLDLAINRLQIVASQESNPEKIHYYLSLAYEKKEDRVNAKAHLEKAIAYGISTDLSNYYRNLAKLYDRDNDHKNAIMHYRNAIEYGADDVLYYYLARACDIYYQDKSIAVGYYEKFINSDYPSGAYKSYAERRSKYLKENIHQSK